MKVCDHIVLNDDVNIGSFKKHGMIIKIDATMHFAIEILFADGVVEAYHHDQCKVISDKEYFKLQLS